MTEILDGSCNRDDVLAFRAMYGSYGNTQVERGEPAVIPNRQAQQIGVGNLLGTGDEGRPEQRLVH